MTDLSNLDAWLDRAWARKPEIVKIASEQGKIAVRCWDIDAADRPVILFVHGFMASSAWWDHIAPHFLPAARILAIDLSGMGDSDARDRYSIEDHAHDVLAVIAAFDLRNVRLVAHSYGVKACYRACVLDPHAASLLVMIDGVPAKLAKRRAQISPTRQHFYPSKAAALDRFRLMPPGEWPNERVLQYIAESSVRLTPQGWTWKFDASAILWFNQETSRDVALDPIAPKRFIYGEQSEILSSDLIAQMAMLPSSGPVTPISRCHHHVMIEQPQALVAALEAALGIL